MCVYVCVYAIVPPLLDKQTCVCIIVSEIGKIPLNMQHRLRCIFKSASETYNSTYMIFSFSHMFIHIYIHIHR